jgi:hypothetical protein
MKFKKQFGEQEDAAASTSTTPATGAATPASKWDSGVVRGKANPVDSKSKWDSGAARGKANPIDSKSKWTSGMNRGKANPLN